MTSSCSPASRARVLTAALTLAIWTSASGCRPRSSTALPPRATMTRIHPSLDAVALERAAHAARPAASPAELAAPDRDHFDAVVAQVVVRGRVALVGDDHAGLQRQPVAAVVPLLPRGR